MRGEGLRLGAAPNARSGDAERQFWHGLCAVDRLGAGTASVRPRRYGTAVVAVDGLQELVGGDGNVLIWPLKSIC
jgi:hypothetical protein